jgi:hypothetical protein
LAEEADKPEEPDKPDRARADVGRTEVARMEQTDNRRMDRMGWGLGLSSECSNTGADKGRCCTAQGRRKRGVP